MENSGVHIPAEIRWLSRAMVRAWFQEKKDGSPVVAAVLGEATLNRLCRHGVRLFGVRYEVDAYEETRPNAFCSRCSGWGHVAPHCKTAAPRCSICARDHAETDHRCPVEGCKAGRGRPCPHGTAKCANCWGPHGARADACTAKREARGAARGWRSPPPPRRERRAVEAPRTFEDEIPAAHEGMEGETGVEMKEEGGPVQTAMEPGSRWLVGPVFSFLFFVCGFFYFFVSEDLGGRG